MNVNMIFSRIKSGLFPDKKGQMYRNLVFKGGGVRGIAYMGALEALEEAGIIDDIERVAGTSSGAVAAALLSFRLPVSETLALFNTLDMSRVPQNGRNGKTGSGSVLPLKNADSYRRLFEDFGWYSSDYFYEWMRETVASLCAGNGRATFLDFREKGFRDLHIVASNISRHRAEVFSARRTPHVAVADAVRLSMSIPFFFEALRFNGSTLGRGDYFVDGGLYNNYPLHIFDKKEYADNRKNFREGINRETLGLFLYPTAIRKDNSSDIPGNLLEFVNITVRSMYDSHQLSNLDHAPTDRQRTIRINDCGVSPLRFDIGLGSEEYNALYAEGRLAVKNFFKSA